MSGSVGSFLHSFIAGFPDGSRAKLIHFVLYVPPPRSRLVISFYSSKPSARSAFVYLMSISKAKSTNCFKSVLLSSLTPISASSN